jgi:endo-1,4-beta-xylanase
VRERGLKSAFGTKLQIGCAVGGTLPDSLNPAETELVTRHFNVLTPENCMKPGPLQPEPGRFEFGPADALLAFASERGMNVVGHTLVWHNQTSPWMYATGISKREALQQLEEHIRNVVGHFRGKLQGWDVVNEAVVDGPEGYLRETPCLAALGSEYLPLAFRFARETDPDVELYYNDYSIEVPAKRERTLRLLDLLDSAGQRPHGVGIQGHWVLDEVPFEDIAKALRLFSERGLRVMITELDIDVVPRKTVGAEVSARTEDGSDPYAESCPLELLERQARQYEQLFELFVEHEVSRVTFWGPNDGRSWLNYWPSKRTNHPLLFDRNSQAKPAYGRVMAVAERHALGH